LDSLLLVIRFCRDLWNIRTFFQEFPVLFIQIYFGRFIVTYLSPDALAGFRLASLGAFAGQLRAHFLPASCSKNPRPFRARNTVVY
jgi:hypothetical protein